MAQFKDTLEVQCDSGDKFLLRGRPCELSAFSFVPPVRPPGTDRNAFNIARKTSLEDDHATFNSQFLVDYGYEAKLHRCDRRHAKAKDLKVNEEERPKVVPTLSSGVYGHRVECPLDPPGRQEYAPLDPPKRHHVRIQRVRAEFFRRNGIEGLALADVH
jgi:hypothetical protein